MPSVQCGTCQVEIPVQQTIATDYGPAYRHIRDTHPEQWNEELAAEFQRECGDDDNGGTPE